MRHQASHCLYRPSHSESHYCIAAHSMLRLQVACEYHAKTFLIFLACHNSLLTQYQETLEQGPRVMKCTAVIQGSQSFVQTPTCHKYRRNADPSCMCVCMYTACQGGTARPWNAAALHWFIANVLPSRNSLPAQGCPPSGKQNGVGLCQSRWRRQLS